VDRTDHLGDGSLALACLAGLLGLLPRSGDADALGDPVAALAGVGTALLVEAAFLRSPERLLDWWRRPPVAVGSAGCLVGAAAVARRTPRLLAVGAWGLVAYLVLLACTLAGRNPLAAIAR